MSHTPAPWSYEIHRGYVCIVHQGGSIGSAHDSKLNGETLPMEANGRLMAAAPDLLAALKQCEAQFRFYHSEHVKAGKLDKAETNARFADLARDAIARAEGLLVPKDGEAKS